MGGVLAATPMMAPGLVNGGVMAGIPNQRVVEQPAQQVQMTPALLSYIASMRR